MRSNLSQNFDYVLDTSAVVAFLADEPGAQDVGKYRLVSGIPFIALTELYYLVSSRKGKEEADHIYGLVKSWALPILMPDEKIILAAGRLKFQYRLGIADSYIAAFAWASKKHLLSKDKDFSVLQDEIKIHWVG